MRILFITWDGAGALTPTAALVEALTVRGHQVHTLAHESQRPDLESAGGTFVPYTSAPQLNQYIAQPAFDFNQWFENFNLHAVVDFKEQILKLQPELLIVDCMMRQSMQAARATGLRFVSFVHAAPSAMATWASEIASADLALAASYASFDTGYTFPPNMQFVGPLRPSTGDSKVTFTRKFPHRSLVIASLSSGHQGSFQPTVLQNLCDALGKLPVEGLVTTGHGIDPSSVNAPANVTVTGRVDHAAVLPEAALFITHCGHGSIMVALHAAVPMLCMPPIADQPHNAQLVRALGLGEIINVLATPQNICTAATHILEDAEMHTRSRSFAEQHTYAADPARAVELIEAVAAPKPKRGFLARIGLGR